MIHITKGLMPFWDEYLTDTRHTDAVLSVNHPTRRNIVCEFDKPWEQGRLSYPCVVRGEGKYMMYYIISSPDNVKGQPEKFAACYAESTDGIHWVKPELGLVAYEGSYANNIVVNGFADNFTVMRDDNPAEPPERRYKAVLECVGEAEGYENPFSGDGALKLLCMTSADGIHWEKYRVVSEGFAYDSQNSLHWDPHREKYCLFMRDMQHWPDDPRSITNDKDFRAVRVSESPDLLRWSDPTELDYMGCDRFPMYTNGVTPYPYDTRYYIGFATRYVERREWTRNYDRLCGSENRREEMKAEARQGLAVTDCVFMSSRDTRRWYRFDEACLTPGVETGHNWVYGDCYPMLGLIPTPSDFEFEPEELSLYANNRYQSKLTSQMIRYTFRRDGFASYKADYRWRTLKTVPFTFDGEELAINFRTSAKGSVYLKITDDKGHPIEGYETCEIFGDSVDRTVDFDRPLAELAGRPVIFTFTMRDAELFAMKFR